MKTKICNKCGKELPATLEFFHKYSRKKDGLFNTCKECRVVEKKEYSKLNKEKIKKYNKNYYLSNIDIIKEKNRNYSLLHKEEKTEYMRNYRATHPEYYINQKIYREKNKDKISARLKKWNLENNHRNIKIKHKYNQENKEKLNSQMKLHYLKNKEKYLIYRKRRMSRLANLPSDLTNTEWQECLEFFNHKDAYTGLPMENISQDHIIPLSKGGAYTKNNIIPCELSINKSKHIKDMEEWFKEQSFFSEERLNKIKEWSKLK